MGQENNTKIENIVIIGAGGAGQELVTELRKTIYSKQNYKILGFIDDDEQKQGSLIQNLEVIGNINDIPKIIKEQNIQTVFVAIPSSSGKLMREIMSKCNSQKVKVKIVPRISEIIKGFVQFDQVKDIEVEDVLGRSIVRQDFTESKIKMKDKVVIICGAAGSIGSELSKQIIGLNPKQLICIDWWENGMFYLGKKLEQAKQSFDRDITTKTELLISNIQDKNKLNLIFEKYQPDIVFNAAAYKHVPLMEDNPTEAIVNNVLGTQNLCELANKYSIESFVLISSDKAVNPTNIMGATKRITEKLMHHYSRLNTETKFSAVRFGNVLNSNGSVIPTFKEQIKEGRVTVTHKDIIRYFMSIDEAVQLVIQCWALGKNDEIFVLDMGDPIKILDLAKLMIRLSGKEPEKDVKIDIIGLRPGEKLYEELLTEVESTTTTKNDKIFVVAKDESFDSSEFMKKVSEILQLSKNSIGKIENIEKLIKQLVPTFKHG